MQRASWERLTAEDALLCDKDTFRQSHGAIPNDVHLLGMDTLASLPTIDLITAGWKCKGHSRAGQGKGLRDHTSMLFYDLVRIIALCHERNNPQVGYVMENVNHSDDTKDNVVMDFQTIRYVLGTKVVTDAPRHTSCAHRVREFWTNMVNPGQLQKAVELTNWTTTTVWKDCLETSYTPNIALRQETKPLYWCNITGALVRVAPTFVSYQGSHAFTN